MGPIRRSPTKEQEEGREIGHGSKRGNEKGSFYDRAAPLVNERGIPPSDGRREDAGKARSSQTGVRPNVTRVTAADFWVIQSRAYGSTAQG